MIDHFSREEFENALPIHKTTGQPLWSLVGLVQGEFVYRIAIDDKVSIEVRSSVRENGQSADTGKDSIRCWLVERIVAEPPVSMKTFQGEAWQSLGAKVNRWTPRLPGWQSRLTDILRTLWKWRKKAGDCSQCGMPKHIARVKSGLNKGRIFARCFDHDDCIGFIWLTEGGK